MEYIQVLILPCKYINFILYDNNKHSIKLSESAFTCVLSAENEFMEYFPEEAKEHHIRKKKPQLQHKGIKNRAETEISAL